MEEQRRKINGKRFLAGALIGALAGVGAGLLFAPRSGRETREIIKEKGNGLKKGLRRKIKSD